MVMNSEKEQDPEERNLLHSLGSLWLVWLTSTSTEYTVIINHLIWI